MDGSTFSTAPRVHMERPTLMSLAYIAHNMREIDKREVFAGRYTDPDALAIDALTVPGFTDIAWLDALPVAAIGGREQWPGVWNVWCWGTDSFARVKFTLSKHIIRTLVPAMINNGGWRGQCYSHEDHAEAHAWLEWLGFEREAVMRQFGRDGSDFFLYVWRHDHVHGWGRRGQLGAAIPDAPGRAGAC